jgi:mRNA interferase HicA
LKTYQRASSVDLAAWPLYSLSMTSAQFKRWLEKQGCTFEPGKGGHVKVFLGKRASILPMHGSSKEIGKGLEEERSCCVIA